MSAARARRLRTALEHPRPIPRAEPLALLYAVNAQAHLLLSVAG